MFFFEFIKSASHSLSYSSQWIIFTVQKAELLIFG